ncbi:helicase [Streptosporangium sp. NPDC051022]|uniref:HelD family protein n=1 Tax=Streptosporangium sp. NPDC051022 TaxID=3155752 RepID=UPI00342D94A0
MSSAETAAAQKYVSMLYERLDDLREQTSARLAGILRQPGETPQARSERDAAHAGYGARLARLNAAENGLCFGRLDLEGGAQRYIGRIGISPEYRDDESGGGDAPDDGEPLLIDWRAPAARPFYLATAVSPHGVERRGHIRTRGRKVVDVHEEILDLRSVDGTGRTELTGEATLLAALNAGRTGHMTDIVSTIQADQDRIIRSGHRNVLVVQGGPGTGKTAVALHRAAFLLYTHRDLLARRGVLIVGPNTAFLRYIERVLPSLGETGVLLSTVGELYPGVRVSRAEPAGAAEIKGGARMAEVVAAAVRDRQWVPADALEVVFEGETLRLDRATCVRARDLGRDSRLPHNQARPLVVPVIVDALARQYADRIGADLFGGPNLLDETQVADIRREMRAAPGVLAAIDLLWPSLTPQRLLTDLFSSPERLASAAPGLTEAERLPLVRDPGSGWTASDVPLLDEAAELLGEDDRAAGALAERLRRERIAYAQGVLDVTFGSRSTDLEDDQEPEVLSAYDLVDADALAGRHEEADPRTTAERAAADRTWTFGHVIVDEAQELSEMAWRLLMRRCPTRWMTLVGDVAQTGDPAGTTSWRRVLGPYLEDRWHLERLTLNYRVPAEIMAVASKLLAAIDPAIEPPRSVRETGVRPWHAEVPRDALAARLGEIVAREAALPGERRLAVIVPAALSAELGRAVADAVSFPVSFPMSVPGASPALSSPVIGHGESGEPEHRVTVLTAGQAKGLEFDSVLVVEPARIMAESARGPNDLYVALTRPTQRLGVVHTGELPPVLASLSPSDGPAR